MRSCVARKKICVQVGDMVGCQTRRKGRNETGCDEDAGICTKYRNGAYIYTARKNLTVLQNVGICKPMFRYRVEVCV